MTYKLPEEPAIGTQLIDSGNSVWKRTDEHSEHWCLMSNAGTGASYKWSDVLFFGGELEEYEEPVEIKLTQNEAEVLRCFLDSLNDPVIKRIVQKLNA